MAGLLLLTQSPPSIIKSLPQLLTAASKYVNNILYIHLDLLSKSHNGNIGAYSSIIKNIYTTSPTFCSQLDVRVLMTGFKNLIEVPSKTEHSVDKVFLDITRTENELRDLEKRYKSYLNGNKPIVLLKDETENNNFIPSSILPTDKVYKCVVSGGTFDIIHNGHKLLLSEALLRCSDKLTLGIADGPLLKRKTLVELIQPCDIRIRDLKTLLVDIDPSLEYSLVPIHEFMGPAGWDPDLEMIVVSEETTRGGEKINDHRKETNLNILDIHCINLIEDKKHSDIEEPKISSSSLRLRRLGRQLKKPVPNPNISPFPHIIGLTGGSASGKSTICKHLQAHGAGIVDCDKLGHLAYSKGNPAYESVIREFGQDILSENGEINRRLLAAKVFSDKSNLTKLNNIVWPEIAKLANEKVTELKETHEIVVLDAAVLLEAGWDKFCHQIWVSFVQEDEAIKRIQERDGKTEEEAKQRLKNQMSNIDRIQKANVVFCSQPPLYTKDQVKIAWEELMLHLNKSNL